MNLKMFLVNKTDTLLEVMGKINANAKGIVYVLNNNDTLVGAITDGDIRRFILANGNLKAEAKDIMNPSPKFLKKECAGDIKVIMKTHGIKNIPILDELGHIIDILSDTNLEVVHSNLDAPVVIMAGGKGTRLYPYTQILPKPLIPINEKTITEIIMDEFKKYGCNDFTMIVNYKKELIKAFFYDEEKKYNVKFIDELEFLGTAGGLKLLANQIDKPFFLNNCDVLIKDDYREIMNYHVKSNNLITVVCALKKEIIPYGTIETNKDGKIVCLKEKPDFDFLVNTGLYVIDPKILDEIPANTFIHITDIIQNCIDKGASVGAYPIRDTNWMDMGQLEELENMRKQLNVK